MNLYEQVGMTPMEGALTPEQVTKVKSMGFLKDKRTQSVFNGRVLTRNGKITAAENHAISECAEKFGSGEVAMTTRLTIEVQGIPYEKIPEAVLFLRERGLEFGGTGAKVRPIVACKGTTCVFGNIDTAALSLEIHKRFFEGYKNVALPHKFKIAVGGCPNNCVKPELNDLGIIGVRLFTPNLEKCRGCKRCLCSESCPMKAMSVQDGKVFIDPTVCNKCGRCQHKCPFGVMEESTFGYKVVLGGRWGKKTATAQPLSRIFTDSEEVMKVIEKAICFFRDNGVKGERFTDTISRIGFEKVEAALLED